MTALAAFYAGSLTARAQLGSNAYNFLELPSSTQSFGLGGAAPALVSPSVAMADQNPALMGPEMGKQLSLGYMHYLGSANFASARFGNAAGEHGAWMIGVRYLNYGSMTMTMPDGTESGSFSPQDIVFEGGYSHDFNDRIRGGISLKGVYSNYEQYTAFALGVDLGLNYYNPDNDLSLALVVKNLGGQIKRFDSSYDRLPVDIQLGYMQGLGSSPFSLMITAWNLQKWNLPYYKHDSNDTSNDTLKEHISFGSNFFRHFIFGLQYQPSDNFWLNIGYNYKTRTDMSTYQRGFLSGMSAGLGIDVSSFSFGVAYAQPHKHASSVMLNISCDLDLLLQ